MLNDILTRQQYKSPRCGLGKTRGRVQWGRLQGGGNICIENSMPCLDVVSLYLWITAGIKLPGCSFGGSRTRRCHNLVAPWLLSHPGQAIIINMIVIADLKSSASSSSSEKSRCSYLQQQRYTIDGALERSRWILISQRFKIENF